MERKYKNAMAIIVVLLITLIGLGSYMAYDKFFVSKTNKYQDAENNNEENKSVSEEENETPLNNIDITDLEIKELYDFVKVNEPSGDVCFMNYYQNPFNKNDIENLVAIVLERYAESYKKEITNEILNKIDYSERNMVKDNSMYYISLDVVKKGLQKLFNIDAENINFSEDANYGLYSYRNDANIFVDGSGGGSYDAIIIQQIISYQKSEEEIAMIVVKAEARDTEININNGESIIPAGIYRYFNNTDTKVYKNISSESFAFTEENVDKFPQIKYIFRKNDNGNYYIYDIVNLNYQNEYESCN